MMESAPGLAVTTVLVVGRDGRPDYRVATRCGVPAHFFSSHIVVICSLIARVRNTFSVVGIINVNVPPHALHSIAWTYPLKDQVRP